MIQAFEQLQKEVKNISTKNQKLQTIINDYTLFYASDQIEKNRNPKIFNNILNSNIIVINKYNNQDRGSNDEFFIISFEKTIILIDSQKSFSYLNDLFSNISNIKICFFNEAKKSFIQNSNINFQEINNNCYIQEEIDNFNMQMPLRLRFKINNSISNMWKFIRDSIYIYLITKSYNKVQTNRIRNYVKSQSKQNSKSSDILIIKQSDYIELRVINSGSKFKSTLIYHIEKEELYVVKKPYDINDSSKYITREINNYLKLNHPLIPKLIGKTDENYIVIEFIDGQTLDNIVPLLNFKQIVNIILQIMFIIEFIHYNHFIYSDLKPDNIMIDKDNSVVLIDFEKMIPEKEEKEEKENRSSVFSDFISPEMANSKDITYYGDVFSIGKVMNYIKFHTKYKDDIKNKGLQLIITKCTEKEIKLRPTIYGLIYQIKKYCHSEIDYYYYDFLFNLNSETAQKNIDLNEGNPYLKINLGFILLEKQKDISIYNQGHELFKSIDEKYIEVEFVLNRIFEIQRYGYKMIDDRIFNFIHSFPGHNEDQFDDVLIQNLYHDSNQNNQNAKFFLGMLHLKLIDNKEITKRQFQYAPSDFYNNYIENKEFLNEIAKNGEKFVLNIPIGIKYLEEA